MYLSKSRHGIYYFRRNGRRKSLSTKSKSQAMQRMAELLVLEKPENLPVPVEDIDVKKSVTVKHAGAEVTIVGQSLDHELSIAQAITNIKVANKTLTTVLELFSQEKIADKSWTEKTAAENRRIIEHFISFVGDGSTAKIGYDALNNYKQHLLSGKRRVQTINKYMSRLGTFCSWMERHGYVEKNYARGMQLKRTQRPDEDRERFTLEQVQIIFSSLAQDAKHPYMYWLPLLGYYTGARLNELCQLHCSDVYDGIIIDINDNSPDKRLKNRASRRKVPIHSELIRLGFEDFAKGKGRVFEELPLSRDGYGKNPSRWFGELVDSLGIEPTFHSFRHTFSDELKQALVNPFIIDELTGHAAKGESMGRYGKRFKVDVLRDAVEKIPIIEF